MFFIGISIPFIGILLIIFYGFSNSRDMIIYQLYTRRKRRQSLDIPRTNPQDSYLTISMNSYPNLHSSTYISNITTIPLEDDEELMKCDISSNFCDNNAIELRLEQDLDSDNDPIDN